MNVTAMNVDVREAERRYVAAPQEPIIARHGPLYDRVAATRALGAFETVDDAIVHVRQNDVRTAALVQGRSSVVALELDGMVNNSGRFYADDGVLHVLRGGRLLDRSGSLADGAALITRASRIAEVSIGAGSVGVALAVVAGLLITRDP